MKLSSFIFLTIIGGCFLANEAAPKDQKAEKPLRIAMIAPLFETVPPEAGSGRFGQERAQHIHELTEALVQRGHQVTLFAAQGSKTKGKLVEVYWPMGKDLDQPGYRHPFLMSVEHVRQRVDQFDVFHFHMFEHFAHCGQFIGKTVTTLYGEWPNGGTVAQMSPLAKLFPYAPIVVPEAENYIEITKHWRNVLGTVPMDNNHSPKDLAEAYEQMYGIVLENAERTQRLQEAQIPTRPTKAEWQQEQCSRFEQNLPLRVAIFSPATLEPLPPKKAGGTERIVYSLAEGLHKRGQEATLIAACGSKTNANLLEIPFSEKQRPSEGNWVEYMLPVIWAQELTNRHAHEWDIMHFQDIDQFVQIKHDFLDQSLVTRHLPFGSTGFEGIFFREFQPVPLVSISNDQRRHGPEDVHMNWLATVHNGIPIGHLHFSPSPNTSQPYLAWMGRMMPEKGLELAVEFARQTGMRLRVAAQIQLLDRAYWENEIKPLFERHGQMVEFLGEIGDAEKSDFLGNATAFLATPIWEEPFGLTPLEAMATGTPVIANKRGAMPEIIEHGVNGYVFSYDAKVGSLEGQVKKIGPAKLVEMAAKLDRKQIRRIVETKWSDEEMIKGYEGVYRQMVARNCARMEAEKKEQHKGCGCSGHKGH